ncbi:MAG: tetratricopeptide repeat-containing sulfotransferase family protein [Luteimonas sp.]
MTLSDVQVLGEVHAAAKHRRLLRRAESYRNAGLTTAAIDSLDAALSIRPDDVAALLQLAELQLQAGRHDAGRAAIHKALQGRLESPQIVLQVLQILNQLSESGLMVEVARRFSSAIWSSPQILTDAAYELSLAGANDLAREFAQGAFSRNPNHPRILALNAMLDVYFGDLSGAAAHSESCLQVLPGNPASHWLVSRLGLPDAERRIARIEAALAKSPPLEDRAQLAYALHNELHETGQYERAWEALEHACRAKRDTLHYNQAEQDRLFQALLGWTATEIAAADGYDADGLAPIFIIGLHRSGTTLAERILTGHSRIAQGGETYGARAIVRRASDLHFPSELDQRAVQTRSGFDYRAMGADYLRGMAWRADGLPFVTDKLPSNYYYVGFLARALPRARFIHLNRDPIDVGLSSLRTMFSSVCGYSYSQEDFIAHWRNYRRLMDHWRSLLPERILDVHYDELVNDPEDVAARMARFCGLDPEPRMVQIDKRKDAVSTASSVMVRGGIRRDRGRLWTRYERHLQPLIRAFGQSRA